jgi:hypothetical protein
LKLVADAVKWIVLAAEKGDTALDAKANTGI